MAFDPENGPGFVDMETGKRTPARGPGAAETEPGVMVPRDRIGCSFCGKPFARVGKMVSAPMRPGVPVAFICDECLVLGFDFVAGPGACAALVDGLLAILSLPWNIGMVSVLVCPCCRALFLSDGTAESHRDGCAWLIAAKACGVA
jgi:hypothetical protein